MITIKDSQSRKWFVTINNPIDKGFTHEYIMSQLNALKSIAYICLADEISENGTYHTHIFIYSPSPIRFSTLKKALPPADLENARGTAVECREYIEKSGKWADSDKGETSVPGTFEEWGEFPQERQGARTDLVELYELIKDGKSNAEIIEQNPDFLLRLTDIDRTRQTLREEEYRGKRRLDISVTYLYGKTRTGKTRYVYDTEGDINVYRVTNYKNPFDGYKNEPVIAFDEFNSQLPLPDMNNYLDIYSAVLPARYNDKVICYEKVYIISNMPLTALYPHEKEKHPDVWDAFVARIHRVIQFLPEGKRLDTAPPVHISGAGGREKTSELPNDTSTPWDGEGEVCPHE